jgi:hypothetical protein
MRRFALFGACLASICAAISPAAQSRTVDTSAWKMFRSDALGFSVKYPPTWRPRAALGTNLESVRLLESSQTGQREPLAVQFIVQRRVNPRGMSIGDWYEEQAKRVRGSAPSPARTMLGGRAAIRRDLALQAERRFDVYAALNSTDIFQVSISEPPASPGLDPIYEAILATVEFNR